MIGGAGFAYALARLHARLAERMDEPGWQQLETSLDLGHALELAGRSRLARFTRRLTRASDVHMIEEVMREEFHADLKEIESWLPRRCRPVIAWFAELPCLREKAFAASGEVAPAWFDAPEGWSEKQAEAWADAAAHWRAQWSARIAPTGHARDLNRVLAPMLERYLGTVDGTPPAPVPWAELERHFMRAFRAGGQGPVVVCAYLGLFVLDTERLRGILTARALFAGGA